MNMMLIVLFVVCLFAFSVSALCGGGAGLMILPLLGQFLPVSEVPAALSIGTFTNSASRLVAFWKNINWAIVKYFVPASLPAVWLGAWLLRFMDPKHLQIAMGLFLISNLTFLFKKHGDVDDSQKPSNAVLSAIGFLAGLLSGLMGVVGLLFNRFYLRYGLTKGEVVATRAANEIILNLMKVVLYTLFGLITMKGITIGVVVAVSAILSAWVMKWLLPLISENAFRKLGYLAMVLSGMLLLTRSVSDLVNDRGANITAHADRNELTRKLHWLNTDIPLELIYERGFTYEHPISESDLTPAQHQWLNARKQGADKVIIEELDKLDERVYKAYFFHGNSLDAEATLEERRF